VWLGNDVEYCKTDIAPESQNVKEKYTCVDKNGNNSPDLDELPTDEQIAANNEAECTAADGAWIGLKHNAEGAAAQIPGLDCQPAPWTQVNNLGNTDQSRLGGQTASYMWTLPSVEEMVATGCHRYSTTGARAIDDATSEYFVRMVVRNRYNISTMDYDPYQTNATMNQDLQNGVISPIQQNPTVDTGAHMQGLRLAINTAQTGRVFQDRSHVFTVFSQPVPSSGDAAADLASSAPAALAKEANNLLNVNVRGKRGNIVQTFPAVEYDFEPNDITMQPGQCLHFQWTGSNTHNNGNPAGDGQAGDAGEGRGGTDRSNLAELQSLRGSYPRPYDVGPQDTFLDQSECKWALSNKIVPPQDAKVILASGGYYSREQTLNNNDHSIGERDELDPLLNNVSASFRQGLVCCPTQPGEYYLVSTRNNNFSNRAQKLHIVVTPPTNVPNAEKWEFYAPMKNVDTTVNAN